MTHSHFYLDSSVNILQPDKISRKKSLQLHPKNIDTAGPDVNNNSPSRSPDFIGGSGTMDDFTSAFADADSPSRRRRGACLLDLSILQELQRGMRPKVHKTKDVASKEILRRKSCYCKCCGGLSSLEKKTLHLPSSPIKREFNEVVEQAKALIKPQKVTKKAAFFDKSPSKTKKAAVVSIDEPQRQRSISISSKTGNNGSRVLDNAVFDMETRNRTRSYNSRQDLKNSGNDMDSIVDLKEQEDPLTKMKSGIPDNKDQQLVHQQQEKLKKTLSPQKSLPVTNLRSETVPHVPKTNPGTTSIKITKIKANIRVTTASTQIRDPSRRGARVVKSSTNIKSLLHPPIQETPGLSQSSQMLETVSRSIPTNTESFISSSNSEIKDEKIFDKNYIFTPPTEHPLLSLMTQRTSIASQRSYAPPQNYGSLPKKRALSLPKLRVSSSPPKNIEPSRFLIIQRAQRDERVAFVQSRIDNIKKLYFNSQRALSPDQSHNLSREKSRDKKDELESNQNGVKDGTSFNRIVSGVRDLSSLQTNRAYLHTKKIKKSSEKNFVTLHQIANVFPKHKRKN